MIRVDVRLKSQLKAGTLPKDLLIDGPAGTGKTYGILTILHLLAKDYRKLRILICRRTRASLTESVLTTFEEEVLPADGSGFIAAGERRDHRANYRYPGGSRIVLGGLDKPDRLFSTAWDLIYINEAIEVTENAWETLGSRLNRPGRDRRFGFLIGDTNPGDPAHWLKKRCDRGHTAHWETAHAANPGLFDRHGWTRYWEPYRDTLDKLRGTRRRRLKDGLWAAGEGAWFSTFDPEKHVSRAAEFDPRFPVHLAVDTGVHTGAVWFQVRGEGENASVTVFGDYYSFDLPAYDNALAILKHGQALCGGRFDVGRMDPSGNASSGFGDTTVGSEYRRARLRLEPWPKFPGCVASGLTLLESFVSVEPTKFLVHPRCTNLVDALPNYKRKQRGGQFIDEPEDPQHPYEETVDALRSGLLDKFPDGRKPAPVFRRVATPGGRFR